MCSVSRQSEPFHGDWEEENFVKHEVNCQRHYPCLEEFFNASISLVLDSYGVITVYWALDKRFTWRFGNSV